MDLSNARTIIENSTSDFDRQIEAVAVIAASPITSLHELAACLCIDGLPAELAALELYRRTGRPRDKVARSVTVDFENWRDYLKQADEASMRIAPKPVAVSATS